MYTKQIQKPEKDDKMNTFSIHDPIVAAARDKNFLEMLTLVLYPEARKKIMEGV